MALVLDTGVLYSALDENDRRHDECAALLLECKERHASADAWLGFAVNGQALELLPG